MNWITGWDRQQRHFLPECLEDHVRPDNPVRFLDAFVDQLDLRAAGFLFPKQNSQGRGRPAYHPACLLKLYLYGYLRRIRSSRLLQTECSRNLEVIWLLGKLAPDFKTIADLRKLNASAFKAVVRQFNQLCRELELFGRQLIALDGTKVKAQNSPAKNWSVTKLEKQLEQLDEQLEQYLQALDQADEDQEPRPAAWPTAAQLVEKIQRVQAITVPIQGKLQQMKELGYLVRASGERKRVKNCSAR